MPTSVFQNTPQSLAGVVRAEDVTLTFPNEVDAGGAMVQQVQMSCERSVNMMYEIGSAKVYYVGDRRRGTANFSRVVGGVNTFKAMIAQFGNLCKAVNNHIDLSAGSKQCGGAAADSMNYKLISATLTSIGAAVTAQDIVVTESMGFMFVDLEYTPG